MGQPLASFGTDAPSATAMAQQMALHRMLYFDAETRAKNLVGDHGTLLRWRKNDSTWPPAYTLLKSGAGRYFLAIAGTTRYDQGVHQAGPTTARYRYRGMSTQVAMIWQRAFQVIWDELKDIPELSEPGATYHISGHSYGGAVAQLLANEMADRVGKDRVQLMTFGQPSPLTEGYNGPEPEVFWRLNSPEDPVRNFPLTDFGLLAVDPHDSGTWLWSQDNWQHRGTAKILWASGDMEGGNDDVRPLPPNVELGLRSEHGTANYLGRIREYNLKHDMSDVAAEAIERGLATPDLPDPPGEKIALTLPDTGLPEESWAEFIRLTNFANLKLFAGGATVAQMKLTLVFHGIDSEKWTETYSVSGSTPEDALAQFTVPLMSARLAFLSGKNKLAMIRATSLDYPRASAYRKVGLPGALTTVEATGGPSTVGLASVWSLGTTGNGRRMIWFRGGRDEDFTRTNEGIDRMKDSAQTDIVAYITLLGAASFGIFPRAKVTLTGEDAYRNVTRVDGSATPGYAVVSISDVANLDVGQRISFSGFSKKDLPNFNGTFEIHAVGASTITVRYKVSGDRSINTPGGRGRKVRLPGIQSFRAEKSFFSHIGTRNTNRSFTHSRGRSRAARIRTSG